MKVILLQNVAKLGQKGDIKNVNDGHAHNFLIPRGLVKFAPASEIKNHQNKLQKQKENENVIHSKAKTLLDTISNSKITLKENANEKGNLFAQVHLKEIADAIASQLKVDISEDWINLTNPIKETGEFDIKLEAYDKKVNLKLYIEAK